MAEFYQSVWSADGPLRALVSLPDAQHVGVLIESLRLELHVRQGHIELYTPDGMLEFRACASNTLYVGVDGGGGRSNTVLEPGEEVDTLRAELRAANATLARIKRAQSKAAAYRIVDEMRGG